MSVSRARRLDRGGADCSGTAATDRQWPRRGHVLQPHTTRLEPSAGVGMLMQPGDRCMVGSNTTGAVAERLQRRWIAMDQVEEYLAASKFRFEETPQAALDLG